MELKLHGNVKNLTGQRFGKLAVIEPSKKRYRGNFVWLCECDCGNKIKVQSNNLVSGSTKSCGCLRKELTAKRSAESEHWVNGTNVYFLTQKIRKNNTSGHKGVYWDKKRKKWLAGITFKGKKHNLGGFEDIQDAINARKEAEEIYFKPILEKYEQK